MPWSEPGEDPPKKDPWTGQNKSSPQFDQLLRRLQHSIPYRWSSGPTQEFNWHWLFGIVLLCWGLAGFFIVSPAEQAVVVRFGRFVETLGPGPHWVPRLIEKYYVVDQQKIYSYEYQKSDMLTKDENIISVELAVWFSVENPKDFLFNVDNPEESLQQATASALRQVIGNTNMETIITSGRNEVIAQTKQQLISILEGYHTGLRVTDVVLRMAKAPEAVKEAFDDATKAQEEEQRLKNEAQAYVNRVIPEARGHAQRLLAEAQAYRKQVVLDAQADTIRFNAVYARYKESPRVTRERMYFDAMQAVLGQSTKLLLDAKSSNNMFYIPFDKIITQTQKENKKPIESSENKSVANAPIPLEATNTPLPSSSITPSPQVVQPKDNTPGRNFISRENYLQSMRGRGE